jgi:thioredoxin 1
MNKLYTLMLATLIGTTSIAIADVKKEITIDEVATPQELDALLSNNTLAVVQFYNPTCPVCNAFKNKGIFPKMANALPHIKFAKVSSVQGEGLHHEYKIEAFPTFIFFKNGKEINRYKGYVEAPQFIKKTNAIFSNAALKQQQEVLQEAE